MSLIEIARSLISNASELPVYLNPGRMPYSKYSLGTGMPDIFERINGRIATVKRDNMVTLKILSLTTTSSFLSIIPFCNVVFFGLLTWITITYVKESSAEIPIAVDSKIPFEFAFDMTGSN
jgi:hypothetical protein